MKTNKVKEFINDIFGEVRTINKDGELWFVASDIAKCLGDRDANIIIRVLDDEDKDTHVVRTLGGNQELSFISESGLYQVILTKKPKDPKKKEHIKAFKKWITKEVIPTIRQDGMYVNREEEMESVDELNQAIDEAFERKILRKYGIGVRKDLTSTIKNNWLIRNKYQMATYTNELVYKPLFGKSAKDLKEEHQAKSLRDELFTEEELIRIANAENEISTLVTFGSDYYQIKDYMNHKYAQ